VYAVVPSLYVCTCLRMHMYISVYIDRSLMCVYLHTTWVDKCLTPNAGEDRWGQAFVEPLGVYVGVPRLFVCM